jgi:hypothetical protein
VGSGTGSAVRTGAEAGGEAGKGSAMLAGAGNFVADGEFSVVAVVTAAGSGDCTGAGNC